VLNLLSKFKCNILYYSIDASINISINDVIIFYTILLMRLLIFLLMMLSYSIMIDASINISINDVINLYFPKL